MSEPFNWLLGAAAIGLAIYLIGPAALWDITKAAAEWLLLIAVLLWLLPGLISPC